MATEDKSEWTPSPNFNLHNPDRAEVLAKLAGVENPVEPIHISPEAEAELLAPYSEKEPALQVLSTPATELDELIDWWLETAQGDTKTILQKYKEYGNTSLSDLGYHMAELMGWQRPARSEAQLLGIYYFMHGKMARWKTAILKGEAAPSDDTLLDLTNYAMMARRTVAVDGWPFAQED